MGLPGIFNFAYSCLRFRDDEFNRLNVGDT